VCGLPRIIPELEVCVSGLLPRMIPELEVCVSGLWLYIHCVYAFYSGVFIIQ